MKWCEEEPDHPERAASLREDSTEGMGADRMGLWF